MKDNDISKGGKTSTNVHSNHCSRDDDELQVALKRGYSYKNSKDFWPHISNTVGEYCCRCVIRIFRFYTNFHRHQLKLYKNKQPLFRTGISSRLKMNKTDKITIFFGKKDNFFIAIHSYHYSLPPIFLFVIRKRIFWFKSVL